jgi:hypothetical protein
MRFMTSLCRSLQIKLTAQEEVALELRASQVSVGMSLFRKINAQCLCSTMNNFSVENISLCWSYLRLMFWGLSF